MKKENTSINDLGITKDTTLGEIIHGYKNAEAVLSGFGLHCFSCPMAQMETIEEAGSLHGVDLDLMVRKLNEDLLPNKKKSK